MIAIQVEYQGDLQCKAVHGPSRVELSTDAPTDNQGRGENFSPTDLVATALASCVLTTMGSRSKTGDRHCGSHRNGRKGDEQDGAKKDTEPQG